MRPLILQAFALGGLSPAGLWAHPDDRSRDYTDVGYWVAMARQLEDGGFDGIFIADGLGHPDVYGGDAGTALRLAVQTPLIDPAMLVSAMAAATEHLGFGITVSATYEQPYLLARRFSTLDHLTRGRIAWNVVTSAQDSAARNLGLDEQIPHDERYDRAQEFMEVCYQLWEGSWEDGAVRADAEAGIYADPAKVHPIGHDGKYYRVPGMHLCQPSPQRTPVIYQAGASPRGIEFAAANAEVVFLGGPTAATIGRAVRRIRALAAELGRGPDAIRFVCPVSVVTGPTAESARARHADLVARSRPEAALVLFSSWTGIDWSVYDPDEPLAHLDTEASRSTLANFTQIDPDRVWTLRGVAEHMGLAGIHPKIVGDGPRIAEELADLAERTGLDGYVLATATVPGTVDDFVRYVMPVLRDRGLVAERPARPVTLRERLQGHPRLRDDHPGARVR